MEIEYLLSAENDLNYWIKTNNKLILKKITLLIEDILISPYQGIGKPEALKYRFLGLWSRRINKEHRLVYEVIGEKLVIHSLKGHYKK